MSKRLLTFFLLAIVTLLPVAARAQSLGGSAEQLRDILSDYSRRVQERMDKGGRRDDVIKSFDKARGDLSRLSQGAQRNELRANLEEAYDKAREHINDGLSSMGDRRFSEAFRGPNASVSRGLSAVSYAWSGYNPVPVIRRGYTTPARGGRDSAARSIAVDYLGDRYRVRADEVFVPKLEQVRDLYRVRASIRGVGTFDVMVDPDRGRVLSSTVYR